MPTQVKGSQLAVGDVILDIRRTGDTHPFLVVAIDKSTSTVVMRNCTSFENSALTLIKIPKGDKDGDEKWAGKDSHVVKSGQALTLATVEVTGEEQVGTTKVDEMVPMQYQAQDGLWYWGHFPTGRLVTVPLLAPIYSDLEFRKVGIVKKNKMDSILEELSS